MEKRKTTIEQMEFFVEHMKDAQKEHPKAKIYYDWKNSEIRITYPLPRDFQISKTPNCSPL